jgi:hypothetical protein
MVWNKMFLKATLVSALAGGFLLLGGATPARADNLDSCHRNVQKWESKLDRDANRHGFNSRQANHDRHELAEARESCERRYGNNWHDRY